MGIENSPDILQNYMNDLFHGFKFIRTYIDGLLILKKGDRTYDVHKLELMLNKLKEKDLNLILKSNSLDKPNLNI